MSKIIQPSRSGLKEAATALQQGHLVAFPTETVYGLGGDARAPMAVAAIFDVKQRPTFNPLITHIKDFEAAHALGAFNETASLLARHFWPGALTLVVPRRADCEVADLASAGNMTIALRVPSHRVAQDLLMAAQMPIAAPSANISGRLSPTRAEHVRAALGHHELVKLILDGGATDHGLESTIIGCFDDEVYLLREGAITREEIEKVLGKKLAPMKGSEKIKLSPGRLTSHYAPRASLRLNIAELQTDEALLAFGAHQMNPDQQRNLSDTGNLREAAANLFAMLHELDQCADKIAVMPIPMTGLGRAINDRLTRAAKT